MRALVCLVLSLLLAAAAPLVDAAAEDVDLELVLLADSSGSIDDAEIRFQRQGYADAVTDPLVLSAILDNAHGKIAVTYVEWGNAASQDVVVGWTVIDGADAAHRFAEALMTAPRRAYGRNAIGSALLKGKRLIEDSGHRGVRRVIDLSADSANNWNGPPLETARAEVVAAGIVINGLAVLCRHCSGRPVRYDLEEAFARLIIGGPGSFVVTADSRATFADAVRKKLILEIAASPSASSLAALSGPPVRFGSHGEARGK